MLKYQMSRKNKELYLKLFNKFVFAFKILKKNNGKVEEFNKQKLEQDFLMAVLDAIPPEKRQYH